MKLQTLIIACGIAVVGFVAGRITSAEKNNTPIDPSTQNGASFVGTNDDSDNANSRVSRKTAPITSAEELREALLKVRGSKTFGKRSVREMRELLNLQDRLARSDIKALVRDYAQGGLTTRDTEGLEMLFTVMADRDSESAWKLATGLPKNMRTAALQATIIVLAEKFPDAAVAKLDSIKDTAMRRSLRDSVVATMAKDDPPRALALLGKPTNDDYALVGEVFARWGRDDMSAAQVALTKMSEHSHGAAVRSLAKIIAETDPAAAWDFATENASDKTYPDIMASHEILRQWVHTDPEAALEAAASAPSKYSRQQLLSTTLGAWVAADCDTASRFIMNSSDPDVLSGGLVALAKRPESDRQTLFETFLERVPVLGQYRYDMSNLLESWAAENPREAAAAFAELPDSYMGGGNTHYVANIASRWFTETDDKTDPLRWALSLEEKNARNTAINSIFADWINTDPAAAAAAAQSHNTGIAEVGKSWSKNDPQAAIRWASSLQDAGQRKDAMNNILSEIAKTNPQQATALLASQGLSGDATAVGNIVNNWVLNDANAASNWVKALPRGEARDRAMANMATNFAFNKNEPTAGIAWALTIDNPEARMSEVERIVINWHFKEPQTAKAWVEASNLPEDIKKRLRR